MLICSVALLSPACSAPLYVQELCSFVQKIPPFHCVIIDQNPTDRSEASDFRKKLSMVWLSRSLIIHWLPLLMIGLFGWPEIRRKCLKLSEQSIISVKSFKTIQWIKRKKLIKFRNWKILRRYAIKKCCTISKNNNKDIRTLGNWFWHKWWPWNNKIKMIPIWNWLEILNTSSLHI